MAWDRAHPRAGPSYTPGVVHTSSSPCVLAVSTQDPLQWVQSRGGGSTAVEGSRCDCGHPGKESDTPTLRKNPRPSSPPGKGKGVGVFEYRTEETSGLPNWRTLREQEGSPVKTALHRNRDHQQGNLWAPVAQQHRCCWRAQSQLGAESASLETVDTRMCTHVCARTHTPA